MTVFWFVYVQIALFQFRKPFIVVFYRWPLLPHEKKMTKIGLSTPGYWIFWKKLFFLNMLLQVVSPLHYLKIGLFKHEKRQFFHTFFELCQNPTLITPRDNIDRFSLNFLYGIFPPVLVFRFFSVPFAYLTRETQWTPILIGFKATAVPATYCEHVPYFMFQLYAASIPLLKLYLISMIYDKQFNGMR